MSHWVYILYSQKTDSYYKGQTDDLPERINRHNNGREKATQFGRPWKLVWKCEKSDRASAVRLEKKLKNMSREKLKKFILKYIDGSQALTS